MPAASFVVTSFLGGELSKFAQGRYDRQDYRTCMAVCFNGHPVEAGAWTRRAGTMFAGATRGGVAGRAMRWDFSAAQPYTMEFVDGHIRFRAGLRLATTNDTKTVLAISAANPAVVQTSAAHGWSTGNTVLFPAGVPLLESRQFTITFVDSTHFSLQDAITGANIDGSTLSAVPAGLTISRVQDLTSPYVSGQWKTLRAVQAETNAILLQALEPPQILQATTLPAGGVDAQFSLSALTFLDGPYLDPFTNGVQAVPGSQSGIVQITLAFPAYVSTQAYQTGAFVTFSSINYKSLVDQNVGNQPDTHPSQWVAVAAQTAINNGQGILGTDVGRLVRFWSEPNAWAAGTAYVTGNLVSYNPTGVPGAETFWTALQGSTGKIPGQDTVNWAPTPSNAAQWTWGKITSLLSQVSQSIAGAANIGNMTSNGGLAASFDGLTAQAGSACSEATVSLVNTTGLTQTYTSTVYVGRNFSGVAGGGEKIGNVTLYPSTDQGFAFFGGNPGPFAGSIQFTLYAKASAPANSTDGTILGQSPVYGLSQIPTNAVTITSNDQTTSWQYVWVTYTWVQPVISGASVNGNFYAAELQFFNPPGTGTSSGFNVEILGPALLYTNPIVTWRMGVYSNTTGWPTCGAYHQGRLWLGGAVGNRWDASAPNAISGTTVNFAPTDINGVVSGASAISYTINSEGVNPILWMKSDLQGVLMGTQRAAYLTSAPGPGAITATNVASVPAGTIVGSAFVEPVRTEHTTIFVHRYSRKLMELFPDVYSGKFSAPNLAKDAMHITKPGVAELAYTQAVLPAIWGRNADGSWFGVTYKRDTLSTSTGPTFAGFHRHALGSGRTVESITSGPSVGGSLDAITFVTSDGTTRHVEVMTDLVDEGATLAQATYLDDAVNPTSTSTTNTASAGAPLGGLTLNGLWHLNGKTVQAWIGGIDCGLQEAGAIADFVVANGSIFIPYGDGVSAGSGGGLFTAAFAAGVPLSQMLVGFTFTSQGQLVRPNAPAESGARTGPAFGKKRRVHEMAAQVEGTQGLSFGTSFTDLFPMKFDAAEDGAPLPMNQQATGVYGLNKVSDSPSYNGMICWQVARPYPANVVAIGSKLETQD